MLDKIFAVLSIAALFAFTLIVIIFVRELDLAVVILICLLIGCYDFWSTFRDQKNRTNGDGKVAGS
jgi:divalent metal cation (Fe/Co/Zn/Cd) transporter